MMCSEVPTTGAVLRPEIKNMLCVCAMRPYQNVLRAVKKSNITSALRASCSKEGGICCYDCCLHSPVTFCEKLSPDFAHSY